LNKWAILLLLLAGCHKKDVKSIIETERERELQELMEQEDEFFDSLPEAEEPEEEDE